ncbi:hypothetical protein GCM10009633_17060 [Janibacter melonis]
MKVVDPQGRTWRVSRRWVPWRRRTRVMGPEVPSSTGLGDDPISMIIGLVLLVLFVPVLITALLVAVELLLLLLLVPFVVLGRVLLGRQWRVEVREGWTPVWDTEAGDWARSGRAISEIAQVLQQGRAPWPSPPPQPPTTVPTR